MPRLLAGGVGAHHDALGADGHTVDRLWPGDAAQQLIEIIGSGQSILLDRRQRLVLGTTGQLRRKRGFSLQQCGSLSNSKQSCRLIPPRRSHVTIHVSHRLFEDRWNHGAITG